MTFLAVDIGGTKVALALVSDDGQILAKHQQPSDPAGPASLVETIAAFAAGYSFQAIGVCVPAVLEPDTDRILWTPNLAGWQDVPLRDLLQDRLGCPTFIEYDGHAAVLGEWWQGAGRGYRSVASVIIGTGIGGGFVIGGRLWRGRDRLAGAVDWFPVYGPAGLDHWENLASGPAIARRARQLIETGQSSTLSASTLTAKDVFDAARQGDALAARVVEEATVLIGQGVAGIISLANPEIVVLGGSVGQQGDVLLPTVREIARRWAQPISGRELPIVSSALGEEAGLLGAAYAASLRLQSGE
ncbi:MAG: ROK family protein [Chloroflexi bacterium]|nr:ROK family protein [Chloroflexota bacterium]